MTHRPKYSDTVQAIINACQAAAMVKGVSVIVSPEVAAILQSNAEILPLKVSEDLTVTLK